jgi:hypothetical protein
LQPRALPRRRRGSRHSPSRPGVRLHLLPQPLLRRCGHGRCQPPAIPQQRRRRQHRGHELCTAVLHFQTAQGLTATGCTGPLTRARINTIEAQRPEWVTTLSKENVRTNVSGAQVPGYGLQPPPAVHVRTMMALNNRFNERSVGHRVGNRCAVPSRRDCMPMETPMTTNAAVERPTTRDVWMRGTR